MEEDYFEYRRIATKIDSDIVLTIQPVLFDKHSVPVDYLDVVLVFGDDPKEVDEQFRNIKEAFKKPIFYGEERFPEIYIKGKSTLKC